MAGCARTSPTGLRVRAVSPESAVRKTNFSQVTRRMSSLRTASRFAPFRAATTACSRAEVPPASSPSVIRCSLPVCAMTPGSAITAPMWVTPPTMCSRPRAPASTSSLSTPFCRETAIV